MRIAPLQKTGPFYDLLKNGPRGRSRWPGRGLRALRGPNATLAAPVDRDAFEVEKPMYVAPGTRESNAWPADPNVTK
jgi:hypothetical protein